MCNLLSILYTYFYGTVIQQPMLLRSHHPAQTPPQLGSRQRLLVGRDACTPSFR